MKTYGQFCPVAQAMEILAERWTLLIVRELICGSTRFSELQRGVPLMSRTLLSQRLKTLQEYSLITREVIDGVPVYHLTEAGEALRPIVISIGVWGMRYAEFGLPDEHLDPKLLMWDMQRRLNQDKLPKKLTVVLFRFTDAKVGERRFWLKMGPEGADLCLVNPGFGVDLTVDTDVRTLTEVWRGDRLLRQEIKQKRIVLDGPPGLKRAFPTWLGLSVFAEAS